MLEFQKNIARFVDTPGFQQSLQDKNDLLRLHRVRDAYKAGRVSEALQRAGSIAGDVDAGIATKFQAESQINNIQWSAAFRAGESGSKLSQRHKEYARRLLTLFTPSERWLKLASLVVRTSAELDDLVSRDNADYLALQQHLHARQNLSVVLGLLARRSVGTKRILRKYNQGVRLARIASAYGHPALAPLLLRIPYALATYLIALRSSAESDTEEAFVQSALSISALAFEIAKAAKDETTMGLAATSALLLSENESSEPHRWCATHVDEMPEGAEKQQSLEIIRRGSKRRKGIPQLGDYNPDPLWQIVEKIAFSLNVDIRNENSLLVKRLRIAARDSEPDRQMRFCEHIIITIGAVSPISAFIETNFGLDTAANKLIHCNLYDLHEEDVDADGALTKLRSLHCDSCVSRQPREEDWSYTTAVRMQFQSDNLSFVRNAATRGFCKRSVENDDLQNGD